MKCSKPHPYPILKAVEEMGLSHRRCGYVGDVVDDMAAARAAKKHIEMVAVGFVSGHGDRRIMKQSLIKAGADLVIENPKELVHLVS
jgi:phosphoglycolate phosphatase-like HAD superfamily hydrolase